MWEADVDRNSDFHLPYNRQLSSLFAIETINHKETL